MHDTVHPATSALKHYTTGLPRPVHIPVNLPRLCDLLAHITEYASERLSYLVLVSYVFQMAPVVVAERAGIVEQKQNKQTLNAVHRQEQRAPAEPTEVYRERDRDTEGCPDGVVKVPLLHRDRYAIPEEGK